MSWRALLPSSISCLSHGSSSHTASLHLTLRFCDPPATQLERCWPSAHSAETHDRNRDHSELQTTCAMSFAPDGRLLSPGEVYEAPTISKEEEEWREDLNVTLICPDCKEYPPNIVEEFSSGDTVCGSCGRVLGERGIDTRSEWRTFSNDDQGKGV
jgi:hypothetical protein